MPQKRTTPIYKTCPTCQMTFEVCPPGKHSRYYPSYTQVFCSTACAHKARYRHGDICATLLPTDAAYIAGFLDADGSILMYKRRDAVAMRVTFSNTNRAVLDHIVQCCQAGSVIQQRSATDYHAASYFAQFNADLACTLLLQVEPFLILKKRQAQLAIDFQTRLKDPALKADRSWQYAYRDTLQAMNQRGPN